MTKYLDEFLRLDCCGDILNIVTPLSHAYASAVDKKKRNRDYCKANRFTYIQQDIFDNKIYEHINENTILISVHPCKGMAFRAIEIYNNLVSAHKARSRGGQ